MIKHGFAPQCFPNLIISDKYSLIKLNGIPYMNPINEKKWWTFLASSSFNSTNFLIELIWSKLSINYELPENIFADDLQLEPLSKHISGKIKEVDGEFGWDLECIDLSDNTLRKNSEILHWKPYYLDLAQFTVINLLCSEGEISLTSFPDLEDIVKDNNYSNLSDFLDKLIITKLVSIDDDKLKLTTRKCQTAITNEGKYVAGEDINGLMSKWLISEIE